MVYFGEISQAPFPLLNVATHWKSSNIEACAKKLSQILANNIDNGGRGVSLRIDVRFYRKVVTLSIVLVFENCEDW